MNEEPSETGSSLKEPCKVWSFIPKVAYSGILTSFSFLFICHPWLSFRSQLSPEVIDFRDPLLGLLGKSIFKITQFLVLLYCAILQPFEFLLLTWKGVWNGDLCGLWRIVRLIGGYLTWILNFPWSFKSFEILAESISMSWPLCGMVEHWPASWKNSSHWHCFLLQFPFASCWSLLGSQSLVVFCRSKAFWTLYSNRQWSLQIPKENTLHTFVECLNANADQG